MKKEPIILTGIIASSLQGAPQIKITEDKAKITFDVYTEDYTQLMELFRLETIFAITPLDK